jgi:AraC-like DNA-binding protein
LHPLIHLTPDEFTLLDRYFKLICEKMAASPFPLQSEITNSLSGTFLLEILSIMRCTETQEEDTTKPTGKIWGSHKKMLVDKFIQMVEQSDGRLRKVDDIANQMNITPKYLSTIVKEVMNRRPSVYIQIFTMKAIELRLRFSDMTIQEIANDLNFPNASFFGKYFKERTGMTPLEYRRKYHNGTLNEIRNKIQKEELNK